MTTLPTHIGRYQILSLLGKGGMSVVYLARDPRFNRDVAVKVLSRESMEDTGYRARFETEAQTIASLEHAAIVPVHDFGEADGQPYLVMRHIAGGTLADQLEKGPLHLVDVLRIFNRIAPALDLAHARGVIHRDLKPANILFDAANDPYVADFGIAKLTTRNGDLTGTGLVIGTPAYMSPEQIRAERNVQLDGRSDIYALGAIVYCMMTGRAPFEADSPSGLMMKHLMDAPPILRAARSDLPEALQLVLDKAMAKNRDDRYTSVGEMAAALQKAAHGEAPHAGVDAGLKTAIYPGSTPSASLVKNAQPSAQADDATRIATARGVPVMAQTVAPARTGLPRWVFGVLGATVILAFIGGLVAVQSARTPAALPTPPPSPTLVVVLPTRVPPSATLSPSPESSPTRAPSATPPPEPTVTPAPAPTVGTPRPTRAARKAVDVPAKLSGEKFSGTGSKIIDLASTDVAIMRVTGPVDGVGIAIQGFDSKGEYTVDFVSSAEPYTGVVMLNNSDNPKASKLKIDASSAWQIELGPLASARRITSAGTFAGAGDEVLIIDGGGWDSAEITGNPAPTANTFEVYLFRDGTLEQLLSTSDPVDGPLTLPRGSVTLVVRAIGSWSMTLFSK